MVEDGSAFMRIAVIIVAMSVVTTSSEASQSCMSKTEARQHFQSVHIYWHGQGHCWDATPAQLHRIRAVQLRTPIREAQPKIGQPKIDQPEWRNSRSEILAGDGVVGSSAVSTGARHDGNEDPAGTPWADRWVDVEPSPLGVRRVDIAPVAPAAIIEREAEPLITLRGVALMCIAFVVMIATIKILVVALIYERRLSERNLRSLARLASR
jgi:hypothetical protein